MDFNYKDDSSSSQQTSLLAQKDQIMNQVKAELALANAQELLSKLNEKCFEKCIGKPGSKLDSSEQNCLAKCMDRYMEAWNLVSKAYFSRMSREANH
jgi:import inner membrane translocase subunit TIM13